METTTVKVLWALRSLNGLFWMGKGPKVSGTFDIKKTPTWSNEPIGMSIAGTVRNGRHKGERVTFVPVKITVTINIENNEV